ncbi:MAG TPA: hypothetical protein VF989_14080 [Polyangiaceae bacterium]
MTEPARYPTVGVFVRSIAKLPGLKVLLGAERVVVRPSAAEAASLDAVIGWGHKPTARAAREYAERHGRPYVALEDGFLRSVGVAREERALSLLVDDLGIYYDARAPSRLEMLLAASGEAEDPLADAALLERARHCRRRIVEAALSKYNHAPERLPSDLDDGRPFVVVADQTFEDASVEQGLAGAESFTSMLDAALAEHPGLRVVVKAHPATLSGKKRGYLGGQRRSGRSVSERVRLLTEDIAPQSLLRAAVHVYVCTSQLGFDALIAGKPVSCFGVPFYAGWGMTDDRVAVPRRGKRRNVDELVAAALLLYSRYWHPITERASTAEEVIEHLALQRGILRENSRAFYCFGFSAWKRPFVRRYLAAPTGSIHFARSRERAIALGLGRDSVAVAWSSRADAELTGFAAERGASLWRMEDGFLRSVGLGSDFTAPGSLVLDRNGIYYDPARPSDLETLLAERSFSDEELGRAARLRALIVEAGIAKYNLASTRPLRRNAPSGRRALLVVGQVEDDASVIYGSPAVKSNRELLQAVRRREPEAYLLYKPHPEVLSGNRRGAPANEYFGLWDELVEHAPVDQCLRIVDEVHTMTSLFGFEALLREVPVVTYGQPFYAGWGLTRDVSPPPRRSKTLSLDALVAAALIEYPRYYSFRAGAFCTAEDMVFELAERAARTRARATRRFGIFRRLHGLALSATEWARAR